jgi:hypothetical protein
MKLLNFSGAYVAANITFAVIYFVKDGGSFLTFLVHMILNVIAVVFIMKALKTAVALERMEAEDQ